MLNLIDQKIRKAFSSAAMQYDILTSLHKEIGRELLKEIDIKEGPLHILDVGMGTGYLTKKLVNHFAGSQVIGLDFAKGMIDYAKREAEGFKIVQANANHLPFRSETFDLIVSNLMYQWVSDLPGAFANCHDKLKPGGAFHFTLFGHDTFRELFASLEKTRRAESMNTLPIRRLPTVDHAQSALEHAGFRNIDLDYERILVHFPEMKDLVRWIKDIGANALAKEFFIGKEWLSRASDYYDEHNRDRFGIVSTFEVIWGKARRVAE